MHFLFILYFLMLVQTTSLLGQCPGGDSVWKRINVLTSYTPVNVDSQLNVFLDIEKKIQPCAPTDSVYTFLLMRIGVLYYRLGDYLHAIQYTRKSINLVNANSGRSAISNRNLAKSYYYLSIYYDSLKLVIQRNEAADTCISIEMRENADYRYTCNLLKEKVRFLYWKGDYNLCADFATLGETLVRKYYNLNDKESSIISFANYKMDALCQLNRFTEAENYFKTVQADFLEGKNNEYISLWYAAMANLSKSKEDYKSAIRYYELAHHYDRLIDNPGISAEVLCGIGILYSEKFGRHNTSLQYFYQGMKYANSFYSFYILGHIANAYVRIGSFDSAYYFFQQAFDRIKPGINEKDFFNHTDIYLNESITEHAINLVLDKADAYLQQYYREKKEGALKTAIDIYKTSDGILENIKRDQREIESKLFWRTNAHRLYVNAIEACYLDNDPATAFYFFEKSRAILLNDQISQLRKVSQDDILAEAQLKRKILELSRAEVVADKTSAGYEKLQKELFASKQELNHTEQLIKARNPWYVQNVFDKTSPRLEDIRESLLRDHQALVELFAGDSSVFVILVKPDTTVLRKINRTNFDSTSNLFSAYLANPNTLNTRMDDFKRTAHHLYHLIFGKMIISKGRIIISPAGQYFPFEALVTSEYSQPVNYFLNDFAVSYTYSARYLLNTISNAPSSIRDFMGVAPVQYAANLELRALNGSDNSLNKLYSYFSQADIWIAEKATRANFLRDYNNYKIIQLYTHASITSSIGEPVIWFADSALYLSDLISERRPLTQLIVLSACQTGTGRLYKGEGVFSFNRGFAALGIPAQITNLWSVDNESTYKITELFYKYISEGQPTDIALQKAKLEFLQSSTKEEYQLPYYWAASILTGKTEVIELNKPYPWKWIAIAVALACISFWGWRNWKRKTTIAAAISNKSGDLSKKN